METNSTSRQLVKKVSAHQKEVLVSFLELNLDLAHGKSEGVDGSREMKERWREVAELLNEAGEATKDGDKWKKTWMDLKLYVKNRASDLKAATAPGVERPRKLTDLEKRIVNIMSWNAIVGDNQAAPESGLPKIPLSDFNNTHQHHTSTSTHINRGDRSTVVIEPTAEKRPLPTVSWLSNSNKSNSSTTTNAPVPASNIHPSKRKRSRALEDIMEEFLLVDKRRNSLLERQIDVEKEKVTAINNLAQALINNSNGNNPKTNKSINNEILTEIKIEPLI